MGNCGRSVAGVFGESPAEVRHFEVTTTSLDEFVYENGHPAPDFINLDVEGAEGGVLAGGRRLLTEYRPPIVREIHGTPGREVWHLLTKLGYVARDIVTGQLPATAEDSAVWIRQYSAVPVEDSTRRTR